MSILKREKRSDDEKVEVSLKQLISGSATD